MSLRVSDDEYVTLLAKTGKAGSVTAPTENKGKSKYANEPTRIGVEKFDSKGEAARWCELDLRRKLGEISDLRRQVPYDLDIDGDTICEYVADFTYLEGGVLVVEDFKGFRTPVYRLKRKLMKAIHGVTILETGTPRRKRR